MRRIYYIAVISVFILIAVSVIQNNFLKIYYPSVPDPGSFIKDSSGVLAKSDYDFINNNIIDIKSKTNVSLYIVTIGRLSGLSYYNYGMELFKRWSVDPESDSIMIITSSGENSSAIITTKSMSSMLDFNTREEITKNSGFYFKQYGQRVGLYFIYNKVIQNICEKYSILNSYSFNELPKVYKNIQIPIWLVITSILLMVSLALFYGVSYDSESSKSIPKDEEVRFTGKGLRSALLIYTLSDVLIITVIVEFMIFFGSYMFELARFRDFVISTGIMLVIFAPVFNDFRKAAVDFFQNGTVYAEGIVDRTYWSFFRHYIVVIDSEGSEQLLSSIVYTAKKHNYIKVRYTKNIKYITSINIIYNNIVLN